MHFDYLPNEHRDPVNFVPTPSDMVAQGRLNAKAYFQLHLERSDRLRPSTVLWPVPVTGIDRQDTAQQGQLRDNKPNEGQFCRI